MSKRGKKMVKRSRAVILAFVLLCAAILAGGTAAYFTTEETSYNVIATGLLDMELKELTTDGKPWPEDGVANVAPAMSVDKVVTIVNKGTVDFYARISLEQVIAAAEGVEAELSLEYVELDLNTTEWTEKDGWYYYHRALLPGEETEPLFTQVKFLPQMGNEYMNATLTIDVQAQAVQSRNNGTDALSATGWGE